MQEKNDLLKLAGMAVNPAILKLEQTVLGICLSDADAVPYVTSLISAGEFRDSYHRSIFGVISTLLAMPDKSVDLVSVNEMLCDWEHPDGMGYLVQLAKDYTSSVHVKEFVGELLDMWSRESEGELSPERLAQIQEDLPKQLERLMSVAERYRAAELPVEGDDIVEMMTLHGAVKAVVTALEEMRGGDSWPYPRAGW